MLDFKGFDLWADGYDRTVALSADLEEYPFAGYRLVLGTIYDRIRRAKGLKVLDLGIGTGVLAKKLYSDGYQIYGVDFSEKMLAIAGEAMPGAQLARWDFACGLPENWAGERFDFIVSTYALHHLTDVQKTPLIRQLQKRLNPDGALLIGDVAFETRAQQEACRAACGALWDDEEHYFVLETLRQDFDGVRFKKCSFCAAVLQFDPLG